MIRNVIFIIGLVLLMVVGVGCDRSDVKPDNGTAPPPQALSADQLRKKVADQTLEIERLQVDLKRSDDALEGLRRRLAAAQSELEDVLALQKDSDKEFMVKEITFGILTDGSDWDDRPGDDGVLAFVYPEDAHGDTVKRAGAFVLTVYDVLAPGTPEVARLEVAPADNQRYWKSFPSAGYQFRVPWKGGPPLHEKILLKVDFRDLGGRRFSATREVKYHPPEGE